MFLDDSTWIEGYDKDDNIQFYWLEGTQVQSEYTNWGSGGQPNHGIKPLSLSL